MIVLYARISTAGQTTAHQVTQAETAGFKIAAQLLAIAERQLRLS
jgi:DNA invertase Pin-like site-specific DNA recombinase